MGIREIDNTDSQRQTFIKDFEEYILSHIDDIDRAGATTLAEVRRIKMLLEMLRCDRTSETNQHEYMKLEDFRNRKVLPTPLDVMGILDKRRCDRSSSPSASNSPKPIIKKHLQH